MDGYQSSNDGEIFHFDMPCQGGGIGHNDLVSHPAVVGNMGISHDEVAPAQDGLPPPFSRAPIDGYEFPNGIVTADDEPGRLTPEAQGLWRCTDGSKGKYVAPFTDFGPPFHDHVGFDNRTGSDAHIFTDQAVRTDFHSRSNLCLGVYDGRRMNLQNSLL
jgi:hypothetical protein